MASLIQQRMVIDRARTRALALFWGGAAFIGLYLAVGLLSAFSLSAATLIVLGAVFLGQGIYALKGASRLKSTFEAEHGENAGKLAPVR